MKKRIIITIESPLKKIKGMSLRITYRKKVSSLRPQGRDHRLPGSSLPIRKSIPEKDSKKLDTCRVEGKYEIKKE